MFSKFTESARKVLIDAKKEMNELKHPYIGSEHLVLAMLKNKNSKLAKKLKGYNLEYDEFKKEIITILGIGNDQAEWFLYTPLLKKVIEDSIIESRELNSDVTVELLFSSLIQEGEGIAIRIMISMGIDLDELIEQFSNKTHNKRGKNKKKFMIDEFGYDLNKKACKNELDPVIGREEEIERIIEILCRRSKNNPLLIGEAGVGKTAIVEELSKRIANGNVPQQLKGKRIVSLSMASLVSGTKYRGEFEERVNKIMKEIEDDSRVIIFIDEIHTLVGAGGAEGAIDASNILKPILARGQIKIIGATTTEEFKKYIEDDRALSRRFQNVFIEEPNIQQTKDILSKLKPVYEAFHNVHISDEVINIIVELSDKYIYDRKQPDKSIDILDESCSKAATSKNKQNRNLKAYQESLKEILEEKNKAIIDHNFLEASQLRKKENYIEDKIYKLEKSITNKQRCLEVGKDVVAKVIKQKTKIPIFEIEGEATKKLIKLKEELSKRIIGQTKAIDVLYKISKKIKLGFKDKSKPISLLFVGPTGVGKTLMVKEFSRLFLGDDQLITIDMSEYKEEHTISKIIGSPPGYVGYSNKNNVLEQIKDKPYSVLLLDEIEKAHPSVINLFLQILDEGRIKDSKGNIVRFDNTIIIMTSNVGFSKNSIGFNYNNIEVVESKLKEFLSLEIINRIDDVVVFERLTEKDIGTIISNKLRDIKIKFKKKNINTHINRRVVDEIIEECKYEEFGARKIEKIINLKINDLILEQLLLGNNELDIQTIH
ncbi:MAG: ATP-dependent Clp protease ATP-binding subunit [Bacilli bacterium]|nr:ATP-dependent Clp protease ATP-binding subunit [Bacilli bacterium]